MTEPSPQGDLRDRILAALRDAKKPVTFKAIAQQLKTKDEPLRAALDLAVGEKLVYRWPDFRRSQYFWHLSSEQMAREAVLTAAAAQPLSRPKLIAAAARKLPGFSAERLKPVVSALVAEKQLQTVRALGSLMVRANDCQSYFNAARSFMEKTIRGAGFDPAGFFAGSPLADDNAAALMLEAVRSLEPVRGVPVSTLRLRNHLPNLGKLEFDAAALELRKRQEVFLSQHVDTFNISEEDKSLLIDGQDGTYYVAISLR
jgi:hypothetical protein